MQKLYDTLRRDRPLLLEVRTGSVAGGFQPRLLGSNVLNLKQHQDLRHAAQTAFELLNSAAANGPDPDGEVATMRWARVHGLAHLALDGLLGDTTPERIHQLLRTPGEADRQT